MGDILADIASRDAARQAEAAREESERNARRAAAVQVEAEREQVRQELQTQYDELMRRSRREDDRALWSIRRRGLASARKALLESDAEVGS